MSWYMKRYLKIILKYREIKGTIGTPEFETLIKDFYKTEGENKARWLFSESGSAWFDCIDNNDYWFNNSAKQLIFFNFEKFLLNELESILE